MCVPEDTNETNKSSEETDTKDENEDSDENSENDEENAEDGEVEQEDDQAVEETNSTKSDEITNLQLAWEVIEVAKSIYSRKSDDQNKLGVSECLEKLGEISREKEDYEQAVTDLKVS